MIYMLRRWIVYKNSPMFKREEYKGMQLHPRYKPTTPTVGVHTVPPHKKLMAKLVRSEVEQWVAEGNTIDVITPKRYRELSIERESRRTKYDAAREARDIQPFVSVNFYEAEASKAARDALMDRTHGDYSSVDNVDRDVVYEGSDDVVDPEHDFYSDDNFADDGSMFDEDVPKFVLDEFEEEYNDD
jgi:hypothetical protein